MGDTESRRHHKHKHEAAEADTPNTGSADTESLATTEEGDSVLTDSNAHDTDSLETSHDTASIDTAHDSVSTDTGHDTVSTGTALDAISTDTGPDSGVDTTHDSGDDVLAGHGHDPQELSSVAQTPDSGVDTQDFATDVSESVGGLDCDKSETVDSSDEAGPMEDSAVDSAPNEENVPPGNVTSDEGMPPENGLSEDISTTEDGVSEIVTSPGNGVNDNLDTDTRTEDTESGTRDRDTEGKDSGTEGKTDKMPSTSAPNTEDRMDNSDRPADNTESPTSSADPTAPDESQPPEATNTDGGGDECNTETKGDVDESNTDRNDDTDERTSDDASKKCDMDNTDEKGDITGYNTGDADQKDDTSGCNTAGVQSDVTAPASTGSARDSKPAARTAPPSGHGTMKMEEELAFLREEVKTKAATVRRLQTSMYEQQVHANLAMVTLRTQLRKKEQSAKLMKAQHERQMSGLLSQLLYLEGKMKQEQRAIVATLQEKDDVIRRQRAAIEDLASKNSRLLVALKEAHGYSGSNGISPFPSPVAEKGGNGVVSVNGQQVVLRNKDKGNGGHKVRFSSVKEKLRRHKSSLELYRPEVLETLVEGTLRYGSQENVNDTSLGGGAGGVAGSPPRGLSSDELKRNRLQERKERCRSMVDYPFRLNDLPEVSPDLERGKLTPEPQGTPDRLSLSGSPHLSHPPSLSLRLPQPHDGSPYSDEDEEAGFNGRLAKAASMPQSLSGYPEPEPQSTPGRERPHSLGGVELMSLSKESVSPTNKVSMAPSPTSTVPPGGSESNPFKSFRNVFKRKNSSKQRTKGKRPPLGGESSKQEYNAVNEHFKKYDLS